MLFLTTLIGRMREQVYMSQFQDQHSADRVNLVVIYKYIRNKACEQ